MEKAGILELPHLRPLGRFQEAAARRQGALPLFWAGSGLELAFTGTELHLLLEADFDRMEPWIAVEVNGAPLIRMPMRRGANEICVLRGMTPGTVRRVRLMKETQPMSTDARHSLLVREARWEGGTFLPLPEPSCRLEFVGDSLTSGEGLAGAREESDWVPAFFRGGGTWARMTADLLGAEYRAVSQSGWGVRSSWDNDPACTLPSIYDAVCAPAQGEANRAFAAQEPYNFASWRPDAVIVNLGTNDAAAMEHPARDGFRQDGTEAGLRAFEDAALDFLRQLRRRNPDARLVWAFGMVHSRLYPQMEGAVRRFREEGGDACCLALPAVRPETMGALQHPGPACHREAAEAAAAFLSRHLNLRPNRQF